MMHHWKKNVQPEDLTRTKIIGVTLDKEMFADIKKDLFERMSGVTDSRQPTGDDIRIAWLVARVDELTEEIDKLNKTIKAQCLAWQNIRGGKLALEPLPEDYD